MLPQSLSSCNCPENGSAWQWSLAVEARRALAFLPFWQTVFFGFVRESVNFDRALSLCLRIEWLLYTWNSYNVELSILSTHHTHRLLSSYFDRVDWFLLTFLHVPRGCENFAAVGKKKAREDDRGWKNMNDPTVLTQIGGEKNRGSEMDTKGKKWDKTTSLHYLYVA